MTYIWKSPVGVFWIRPSHAVQGRWDLGIGDEVLGRYVNAMQAADDVYTHSTGFTEWDALAVSMVSAPSDLSEWGQRP